MNRALTAAALVFALLLPALPAFADATVVVRVRGIEGAAAEATVTLTPDAGGAAQSCRTTGGTCRIAGVSSGRYIVTARPTTEGESPLPRPVAIPASGEVTVSVTLR